MPVRRAVRPTPAPKTPDPAIGSTWNSWTVIGPPGPRTWQGYCPIPCRCVCGKLGRVRAYALARGLSRSCRSCAPKLNPPAHGMTNSPEYRLWCAIKRACLVSGSKDFARVGGLGIRLHRPWSEDFAAFYADVGARPSADHMLVRVDLDGHYVPTNVRWVKRPARGRAGRGQTADDREPVGPISPHVDEWEWRGVARPGAPDGKVAT